MNEKKSCVSHPILGGFSYFELLRVNVNYELTYPNLEYQHLLNILYFLY